MSTLILLPFIFWIAYNTASYSSKNVNKISLINPESIRQSVLNINYIFMYIDQILLNYYIKNTKATRSNTIRSTMSNKLRDDDDNSKGLHIYPSQTKNYTRLEGLTPTTPSSAVTFTFNSADSIHKRNSNNNNNNNKYGSCESLISIDEETVVTLDIDDNPIIVSNDNTNIKSESSNNTHSTNEKAKFDDNNKSNNEIKPPEEAYQRNKLNVPSSSFTNNIYTNNKNIPYNINTNNENTSSNGNIQNNINTNNSENNLCSNDDDKNKCELQYNSNSIMTPIEDISFEEDSSIVKNILK